MLHLYAVFHANLSFSFIPHELYPQVLARCYRPLLDALERGMGPVGLEFPAQTLQRIRKMAPDVVEILRRLQREGRCEIIGSGFVQSIMPLIPSRVNEENLARGMDVYEQLMGTRPRMAFVHEQVLSRGLLDLYLNAGFESILADWDSAAPHLRPEVPPHQPCDLATLSGRRIPVVWNSCSSYRLFQDCAKGLTDLERFMETVRARIPASRGGAYPLYGSDWEVFDFEPWASGPSGFGTGEGVEMSRIEAIFRRLAQEADCRIVLPSEVLGAWPSRPMVQVASAAHPILYKKQEIQGIARWAVGGRNNVAMNTQCYRLYRKLARLEPMVENLGDSAGRCRKELHHLWWLLCELWGSDYRTFSTEEKHNEWAFRMGEARYRLEQIEKIVGRTHARMRQGEGQGCPHPASPPIGEPTRQSLLVRGVGAEARRIGSGPDWVPPFEWNEKDGRIRTRSVVLELNRYRGGNIVRLDFPGIFPESVLLNEPVDSLDRRRTNPDAVHAAQFFLIERNGRDISDLQPVTFLPLASDEGAGTYVSIRCRVPTAAGVLWKEYRVFHAVPRIEVIIRFQLIGVSPAVFRIGHMAVGPKAFERESLYFAATNGGRAPERFPLAGTRVSHATPLSPLASATTCLGATDGWLVVGDGRRRLVFETDLTWLYSAPMLEYREFGPRPPGYALGLVYSLGERDDTSLATWRGHYVWHMAVSGVAGALPEAPETAGSLLDSAETLT